VVLFPRQSGKNELQAQLEAYLLTLGSPHHTTEMVKVSPTWRPQAQTAMRRLERVLKHNPLTNPLWKKEAGYIYHLGKASIAFLSASPESNIVGATASTLLEVDEAQDILPEKFDKDIAPMASSTDATRVFYGTAWTEQTLLGRELRVARAAQEHDGIQRVFHISATEVGAEVPAYARFVADQINRLGRTHPLVMTQYFSEEIGALGGMFPEARLALMQGLHPAQNLPTPGKRYAALVDVAGEDEGSGEATSPHRDSTALTLVEIDLSGCFDPGLQKPIYRVVQRRAWRGVKHTTLYAQLRALCELWQAQSIVIDATGIGAGLASFLAQAFKSRLIPFTFTTASKSRLGWDFLAIVDTARYKEPASPLAEEFFTQCRHCMIEALPSPDHKIRWGVPDGSRDPVNGELLHDDLLLSAALVAVIDQVSPAPARPALIVPGRDPLTDLDKGF
jgi:hypothetical protein